MFKTLIARMRAKDRSNVAREAVHPLIVIDRQRIDAEGRADLARRRLALARAAEEAEAGRLAATDRRIAALECRAVQALAESRAPVARQAAEMIARLSADRVWTLGVLRSRATESGRLAQDAALAEAHLGRVLRAGRIVRAEEVVRQLRQSTARQRGFDAAVDTPLAEAEATLVRLRSRQADSLVLPSAASSGTESPAETLPRSVPGAAEILVALRNRVTMASRAA